MLRSGGRELITDPWDLLTDGWMRGTSMKDMKSLGFEIAEMGKATGRE